MLEENADKEVKKQKLTRILCIVILLSVALISFFGISKIVTSPATKINQKTIASLDEKQKTVMELTAASTAASVAVSFMPGDMGTPIAEKLADFSSYFLVVICAIFLEKFLVTITGYATFNILVPMACLLLAGYVITQNAKLCQLAAKLILFGAAIVLVIPLSVKVSDLIEKTYATSIEATLEAAKNASEEIEGAEAETTEEEEDEGFLSGIISKVEETASVATANFENVLNRFIEALAVMLVTSCLIPLVVMFFFVWLIKVILGVDVSLPVKTMKYNNGLRRKTSTHTQER